MPDWNFIGRRLATVHSCRETSLIGQVRHWEVCRSGSGHSEVERIDEKFVGSDCCCAACDTACYRTSLYPGARSLLGFPSVTIVPRRIR